MKPLECNISLALVPPSRCYGVTQTHTHTHTHILPLSLSLFYSYLSLFFSFCFSFPSVTICHYISFPINACPSVPDYIDVYFRTYERSKRRTNSTSSYQGQVSLLSKLFPWSLTARHTKLECLLWQCFLSVYSVFCK